MNVSKIVMLCGILISNISLNNNAIAMDDEVAAGAESAFQRVVDENYFGQPPEEDDEGISVDIIFTPEEERALRLLISSSPEEAVGYFTQGANRLSKDKRGFNILMIFAYNHIEFDADFLNQYTSNEIEEATDIDGNTALMVVMNRANYPQVKVFFDCGHFLSEGQLDELVDGKRKYTKDY